jgi:hypothetical protein
MPPTKTGRVSGSQHVEAYMVSDRFSENEDGVGTLW